MDSRKPVVTEKRKQKTHISIRLKISHIFHIFTWKFSHEKIQCDLPLHSNITQISLNVTFHCRCASKKTKLNEIKSHENSMFVRPFRSVAVRINLLNVPHFASMLVLLYTLAAVAFRASAREYFVRIAFSFTLFARNVNTFIL